MGRMGGPRPRIQGEKKDGAANISGDAAPSGRPAWRRRVDDMDQPISLEKLRDQVKASRRGRNRVTSREGLP